MLNSEYMLSEINRPKNEMQNKKSPKLRDKKKDVCLLYLPKRRTIVISLFPCSFSMKKKKHLTDLKHQTFNPHNNVRDM